MLKSAAREMQTLRKIDPVTKTTSKSHVSYAVPGWFMAIVTIPIVIGLLWFGRDFLIPLAVALLLFTLTAALVDRIDNAKIGGWSPPRWLAHLASVFLVFLVLAVIVIIISNEASDFGEALPRYAQRFQSVIEQIEVVLGSQIVGAIQRSIAEADVGSWLASIAGGASGILASFSLVLLYTAFLSLERKEFASKLPLMAADKEKAKRLANILSSISESVKQYMWINAATSAMSGTVAYIILMLVGVDFAAILALIVFLVGFIPTIGAFIGIALPSLVALLQFDNLTPFLIVLFGYGASDQFISNVVQPAMQGKSLNISTFMVMVSLAFWGAIWGGIGAFLAVPMMVIFMIICSEVPSLRPVAILLSGDGKLVRPSGENA